MGSVIMIVTVVAIGVVIGLLRGGRLDALMAVRPQWWGLLAIGFTLHALAEAVDLPGAVSISVIGIFAMIVGLGANVPAIKGAFVTAFGLTMNLLVLVLNGAVPVRFEALTESGIVDPSTTREQITSVGHLLELETADTHLAFLGDVIPVGVLSSVISIGDLVTFAGVIVIVANLLTARRRTGLDIDEVLAPLTPTPDLGSVLDLEAEASNGSGHDTGPAVVVLDDDPAIDLTAATPASLGAAYDPDDLWADTTDDEGVRILGPTRTRR